MTLSMFDVTIMKHGMETKFRIPAETKDEVYEWAKGVASGSVFHDETRVIDLGPDAYQMIQVTQNLEEKSAVEIEPPAPQLENANGLMIFPFTQRVGYLGEKVDIKGVRTIHQDIGYVVIYEAAGSPVQTVYGRSSLEELTYYVGESFGYTTQVALLPEGDLTDVEAAIEYVEDYVAEVIEMEKKKRDDRNKTASAFVGFTREG